MLAYQLLIFQFFVISLAANSFALEDVSQLFPHKGLEDRINFWKLVFTRFGEREVVFHDEDDLRLIYHIERFSKERKNNPREIRRQRDYLKRKQRELEALFDDISRYGPNSSRLSSQHKKIIQQLENANHRVSASNLRLFKNRIRYQRGIKEKFRDGLVRSGRYLERMRDIFARYNLPQEITYLPHVESSFDYTAYSKVGAAGIWQFTRSTGRSYLRINRYVDERLDPIRATDAAARLMRDNYAVLGNWPLAITGYNHGKNGMLRAKKQHGSDLKAIISKYRSRYFGFASKNFYAEFLAALLVANNYEEYFGSLEFATPLKFETLRVAKAYDSRYFTTVPGLTRDVLSKYNPHLRKVLSSSGRVLPAGIDLRVPLGKSEPLRVALQSAKTSTSGAMIASDGSIRYRVLRGDVLGDIASSFGTSVRSLKRLNGIRNANRIQVGQVLLIEPATESSNRTASKPETYRVRSGDSLTSIAKRLDTTVAGLVQANSITNPNRLHSGMNLQIPGSDPKTSRRYKVRRGDTLFKIARRFGTSVTSIKRANRIRNSHLIRQGQQLLIP